MSLIETPLAGAAYAIRHGNTTWTIERELTVRRLWRAGWSASQIALDIGGGASRNAVIGKLHRLGLMRSDRAPGIRLKCDPAARVAGAKVGQRPDGFRRKALPKDGLASPALVCDAPAPIERSEAACSLAELGEDMCHYPYGEPRDADFAFCGRSAKGTYCAGHHRICYPRSRQ